MSTETKLISCLLMVEMQGLAQMMLARCSGKLALLLPVLHLLLLIERFHFFQGCQSGTLNEQEQLFV